MDLNIADRSRPEARCLDLSSVDLDTSCRTDFGPPSSAAVIEMFPLSLRLWLDCE